MKIKKLLEFTGWAVAVAGTSFLLSFANSEQNKTVCKDIIIQLHQGDYALVYENEILGKLTKNYGNLQGKPIHKIPFRNIESEIMKISALSRADVFATPSGYVKISAVERMPLIKIFNHQNKNFYLDKEGNIFTTQTSHSARVLIANGNISLEPRAGTNIYHFPDSVIGIKQVRAIAYVAQHISNNKTLNALISQIFVNHRNEIELIPLIANHVIILGDTSNLTEKFENLLIFYKRMGNLNQLNRYETINLKYKNQIVCTKNTIYGN